MTAVLGCASNATHHSSSGSGGAGGNIQKPTYSETQPKDFQAVPENTEVSLGPLARPSGYPEAQGWKNPVPPSDCCDPVSEIFPVDATIGDGTEGPPAIEWTGSFWGVSWKAGDISATIDFRTIDSDGLVVGPIEQPFQFDGRPPENPSMRWANDRFAVTYSSYHEGIYVGMLNRYGYAPWGSFATNLQTTDTAIARYTADNVWLIAGRSQDPTGNSDDSLLVWAVDNSGLRTNDPVINLGVPIGKLAIAGLKNRANVVWITSTGFSSRAFTWPFESATAGAEIQLFQGPATEDYAVAAVAFRDSVVAAAIANNRVLTFSIDPWTNEILSGPHEIAAIEWPGEAAVGLGAAEAEGYLGVCYTRHAAGGMTVVFRLIGPDGRPWSRENVLTTGDKLVPGCSVAFNGEDWSVAWWLAGLTDNIIHVQLLRPTP